MPQVCPNNYNGEQGIEEVENTYMKISKLRDVDGLSNFVLEPSFVRPRFVSASYQTF